MRMKNPENVNEMTLCAISTAGEGHNKAKVSPGSHTAGSIKSQQ